MKKYTILLSILFFANIIFGQIGVLAAYKTAKADEWLAVFNANHNTNVSSISGINVGVDYWFRLKDYRVEFFPEIGIDKYSENFGTDELKLRSFNIHFNTAVYFLDIEGDCNCPTFSKDGNFLTKGIFVEVSPGWTFWDNKYEAVAGTTENKTNNFSIGVGVGVDVGVSDFITVTPIFRYYFLPNLEWAGLGGFEIPVETDMSQIYLGLKLGFRWRA